MDEEENSVLLDTLPLELILHIEQYLSIDDVLHLYFAYPKGRHKNWLQFSKKLRRCLLPKDRKIPLAELRRLSTLMAKHTKSASFSGCHWLTSAVLMNIIPKLKNVTSLNVQCCALAGNQLLKSLQTLENLNELGFSIRIMPQEFNYVKPFSMAEIAFMNRIKYLKIDWFDMSEFSDDNLQFIALVRFFRNAIDVCVRLQAGGLLNLPKGSMLTHTISGVKYKFHGVVVFPGGHSVLEIGSVHCLLSKKVAIGVRGGALSLNDCVDRLLGNSSEIPSGLEISSFLRPRSGRLVDPPVEVETDAACTALVRSQSSQSVLLSKYGLLEVNLVDLASLRCIIIKDNPRIYPMRLLALLPHNVICNLAELRIFRQEDFEKKQDCTCGLSLVRLKPRLKHLALSRQDPLLLRQLLPIFRSISYLTLSDMNRLLTLSDLEFIAEKCTGLTYIFMRQMTNAVSVQNALCETITRFTYLQDIRLDFYIMALDLHFWNSLAHLTTLRRVFIASPQSELRNFSDEFIILNKELHIFVLIAKMTLGRARQIKQKVRYLGGTRTVACYVSSSRNLEDMASAIGCHQAIAYTDNHNLNLLNLEHDFINA